MKATWSREVPSIGGSENNNNNNNAASVNVSASANDEQDKRKARLIRNRESAQLSRQRKQHYVEELEDKDFLCYGRECYFKAAIEQSATAITFRDAAASTNIN
ncbi:hypothetical protein PS2_039429 [Malus domestica]